MTKLPPMEIRQMWMHFTDQMIDLQITERQHSIIKCLQVMPVQLCTTQRLSDKYAMEPSNMRRLLKSLEAKGYIQSVKVSTSNAISWEALV